MNNDETSARALLRHTLATVAYRGGKTLRDAPDGFADFRANEGTRTPGAILAHICDLYDWALSLCEGRETWRNSTIDDWRSGTERFHRALADLDAYIAGDRPLAAAPERLFQGPVADSLAHIGQIAMLRRMAGSPVKGEDYSLAKIAAGNVGEEQPPAVFEFN